MRDREGCHRHLHTLLPRVPGHLLVVDYSRTIDGLERKILQMTEHLITVGST